MRRSFLFLLAGIASAACGSVPTDGALTTAAPRTHGTPAGDTRVVHVYKAATCTCCHAWEEYMRSHGYTVRSVPTDDMAQVKADRGVPRDMSSCHTAVLDGYVIEGHVPLAAIHDLLRKRPDIDGIALAGMPPGSPGMPGEKAAPFAVMKIDDGTASDFGLY